MYFGKCFKNVSKNILTKIDNIIDVIFTNEMKIRYIDIGCEDSAVLCGILDSLARAIMNNEIDNNSSKFNGTRYVGDVKSLCIASLTFFLRHKDQCFLHRPATYCRIIEYISCKNNRCNVYSPSDEILAILCRFTHDYFNEFVCAIKYGVNHPNNVNAKKTLDYLKIAKTCAVAWIRMIQCCLKHCSPQWLQNTNNTKLWFKIIHSQFRRVLTLLVAIAKESNHFGIESIANFLQDVNVVDGDASNSNTNGDDGSREGKDDNNNTNCSKYEITLFNQRMIDEL